jgi:chromosome segregation ATPase
MTQDLTPEAVAKMCRELRAPSYWMSGSDQGHEGENDKPRAAADMLEAIAAKLAEVEAERNEATNQLDSARHSVDVLEKRVAEVEADKREMAMQSLADLGQAQEAYDALQAAEAEVARLRDQAVNAWLAFQNVDAQVADGGEFTERAWEQLRAALQPKETDHE